MKIHIEEMLNNDIDTVNMKWKTDAEYLERQYKLLKEDFLNPLRKEIKNLLGNDTHFDDLHKYSNTVLMSRYIEHKIIYKVQRRPKQDYRTGKTQLDSQ